MEPMISSTEMVKRTGCTYRQLDYWCRGRVIVPALLEARGSGTGRRFTERQVRVVNLVRGLAALGAKHDVLLKASMAAELIPHDEWFGVIFVDADGDLSDAPADHPCWAIDLAKCADLTNQPPRQLVLN